MKFNLQEFLKRKEVGCLLQTDEKYFRFDPNFMHKIKLDELD